MNKADEKAINEAIKSYPNIVLDLILSGQTNFEVITDKDGKLVEISYIPVKEFNHERIS